MLLNKCKVSQGANMEQTIGIGILSLFHDIFNTFTNMALSINYVLSGCNRIITVEGGKLSKICPFCNKPLDWSYAKPIKFCPRCKNQFFNQNLICNICEPVTKLIEEQC